MIPGKYGTLALLLLTVAHVDSGGPGPSGKEVKSRYGGPDDDGSGSGADLEPPDTSFSAAPPEVTSSSWATFRLVSNESGVSYKCSLDGAAFVACADSVNYANLAEGAHILRARAIDAALNVDTTPATHAWSVDTVPPDTHIVSAPQVVAASKDASFAFEASESGASYECGLDEGVLVVCASAVVYTGLVDGTHTFQVRARDVAGNADGTPARYSWTVDTTVLDTFIVEGPSALTSATSATFRFASSRGDAYFECSLDGVAFGPCANPVSFMGLAHGDHALQVRARNGTGVDDLPASYSWAVDSVAPASPVITRPASWAFVNTRMPNVSGTAEGGSAVRLSLDEEVVETVVASETGAWSITLSEVPADGLYRVEAVAMDTAGNSSPLSAAVSFMVDTLAPEAPVVLPPVDKATLDMDRQVFTGTAEAGSTVSLYLYGAHWETTVASDAGTWALAPSQALAPGLHSITAIATDAAGNSSATSAPMRFTIAPRGYYDFGCSATPGGGAGAWVALALGACLFRPRARSRGRLPAFPGSRPGVLR